MALVTPRTKYVSVTVPHNPTGRMIDEADLRSLVGLVESAGCRLLVDETYREMTFGAPLPAAASLSERAISVSSLSKTYGIPGIRTGWLVCRDRELMTTFLAAKEQIGICGSVVDEEIAAGRSRSASAWLAESPAVHRRAVLGRRCGLDRRRGAHGVGGAARRRASASRASGPRRRSTSTSSTACSARCTAPTWGRATGSSSTRRHMRIGFGWPLPEELAKGLEGISGAITASLR